MRGRLIQVFLAELARLDRRAMSVDPDGDGPLGSAMDPDFREPLAGRRIELPLVRVPCQVEPQRIHEEQMFDAGRSPRSLLRLVMHFRDLEDLGLVHRETGAPTLGIGDRLVALYDRTGALVQTVRTPPGLYVTEVRPIGWGLSLTRPRRNLLLVTFEDRQVAWGRAR